MTQEAGCKKNAFQLHQIDSGEAQGGMELIAHEIDQDVMILSADGGPELLQRRWIHSEH